MKSNEEKKLILKYTTYVYSDGTFQIEKLPLESDEDTTVDEPSAKMTQIIDTLREIKKIYNERYKNHNLEMVLPAIYGQAIKQVADKYKVSPSSIADKLTRQCKIKKDGVIGLITPFLSDNDTSELKDFLTDNIVKSKAADLELIDEFLAENS